MLWLTWSITSPSDKLEASNSENIRSIKVDYLGQWHYSNSRNFLSLQLLAILNENDSVQSNLSLSSLNETYQLTLHGSEIVESYYDYQTHLRYFYISDILSPSGFPGGSDGKVSAWSAGDPGLIPGLGRSLGEGNGSPLQYSCLEKSMDWGAW